MGALINMAGKQRMLSQLVLKGYYECKFLECDFSEFKLAINNLKRTDNILQFGDEKLGFEPLQNEAIKTEFKRLKPHLDYIYSNLNEFEKLNYVSIPELTFHIDKYLKIMDGIVLKYQRESENEIATIMIVEIELAVFSVLILLFEIFFIVNPIISKTTSQNKKLKEISWHQSHAFDSHMKNIKNLQHVLKIERKTENKQEIIDCIVDELNELDLVSKNMIKSLENEQQEVSTFDKILKKMDDYIALKT
tara:strand:+ start:571 stop:1317 length:747 start_codon:yes stop_codon:yes gene_type:complete